MTGCRCVTSVFPHAEARLDASVGKADDAQDAEACAEDDTFMESGSNPGTKRDTFKVFIRAPATLGGLVSEQSASL